MNVSRGASFEGEESVSSALSDRIFYECDRELPEFNVDEHREYAFKITEFYKNNTDDIVAWAKDAPFNILYTSKMRQLWRDLKAGECFAQTLHEEWTDVLENIWRHQRDLTCSRLCGCGITCLPGTQRLNLYGSV